MLLEGILIRVQLGTALLPMGSVLVQSSVTPGEGWTWTPGASSGGLLASEPECEGAEQYPSSCTYSRVTQLLWYEPHWQTRQSLGFTSYGEPGMPGNRLENAQQPIWFYVWCALMVAGGRIKPEDALQRG